MMMIIIIIIITTYLLQYIQQTTWGGWKVVQATVISIILESGKMLGPKAICLMPGAFPWCSSHCSPCCPRADAGGAVSAQEKEAPSPSSGCSPCCDFACGSWDGWWANLVYLCPWPGLRMIHAAPPFPFPFPPCPCSWHLPSSHVFTSLGISCIKGQDSLKASLLVVCYKVIFPPAQHFFSIIQN